MQLDRLPRIGRGTADTADSAGHCAACRQVRRGSGEIKGEGGLLKGKEEEANCVDPYSCSTGILTDGGRRDKNDLKKKKKRGGVRRTKCDWFQLLCTRTAGEGRRKKKDKNSSFHLINCSNFPPVCSSFLINEKLWTAAVWLFCQHNDTSEETPVSPCDGEKQLRVTGSPLRLPRRPPPVPS